MAKAGQLTRSNTDRLRRQLPTAYYRQQRSTDAEYTCYFVDYYFSATGTGYGGQPHTEM